MYMYNVGRLQWFGVDVYCVCSNRRFDVQKMEAEGKEPENDAENYFVNADGQRIFCKYWYPDGALRDQLR